MQSIEKISSNLEYNGIIKIDGYDYDQLLIFNQSRYRCHYNYTLRHIYFCCFVPGYVGFIQLTYCTCTPIND